MKECLKCQNKISSQRSVCPHCGGKDFVSTGQDALSTIDALRKQSKVRDHNNRGGEYMNQSRYREAEQEFRKAIDANPESAVAHGNVGLALYNQGCLDDAIKFVEKAVELNPFYEGASNILTKWRLEKEQQREVELPKDDIFEVAQAKVQTDASEKSVVDNGSSSITGGIIILLSAIAFFVIGYTIEGGLFNPANSGGKGDEVGPMLCVVTFAILFGSWAIFSGFQKRRLNK